MASKNSKSRNGCLTCKKKRLKCDETKPNCLNCVKKNIQCGGYSTNFKWKSFDQVNIPAKVTKPITGNNKVVPNVQQLIHQDVVGKNSDLFDGDNITMKRSLSLPNEFDNAFQQATLSIAGRSLKELAYQHELMSLGKNPNSNSLDTVQLSRSLSIDSSMTSPSLSSLVKAFTDFENNNVPSNLDLNFSTYQQLKPNESAIVEEEEEEGDEDGDEQEGDKPSLEFNDTHFPRNRPLKRSLSLDFAFSPSSPSSSSGSSPSSTLPQYRKELLSFSQSLSLNSSNAYKLTPSPPSLSSIPTKILNSLINQSDFNKIFNAFDNYTCSIMSIKNGPMDNPWRILIWPMALQNPILFKAVASMSLFHISTNSNDLSLKNLAMNYMKLSMIELADNFNELPDEIILSTCLILATTETWSKQISSGKIHLKGAKNIIKRLNSTKVKGKEQIFEFLINTFIYHDVLSKLTFWDNKSIENGYETTPLDLNLNNSMIDPLLGCSKSLFLIIGKVANLISQIHQTERPSLSTISKAVDLKQELEQWEPNVLENDTLDSEILSHCIITSEAYKISTLLYLQQAVPEISTHTISQLSNKILRLLASIPTNSKTCILHIWPLLIASCEINDGKDREWIMDRWMLLKNKMFIGNIDRAMDIIKEVWKRKDSKGKNEQDSFKIRINALVGEDEVEGIHSWTHWSHVMKEWDWQVLFG